jgi:hypothetical protein
MKTNKQTKSTMFQSYEEIDFSTYDEAAVVHFNSSCTLQDSITSIWNRLVPELRVERSFREVMYAHSIAKGYSESWIKKTFAANECLRVRGTRSDKGKGKTKTKAKTSESKPDVSIESLKWEIRLGLKHKAFDKKDLVKELTAFLASL